MSRILTLIGAAVLLFSLSARAERDFSGTTASGAYYRIAVPDTWKDGDWPAELEKISVAARAAHKMGLTVFAGHGLTYRNVDGIAGVAEIEELNIGHSIIARASLVGLEAAVREMIALLRSPRRMPGR